VGGYVSYGHASPWCSSGYQSKETKKVSTGNKNIVSAYNAVISAQGDQKGNKNIVSGYNTVIPAKETKKVSTTI
jgi:hypothetical protein